jgi:hypothetical protein
MAGCCPACVWFCAIDGGVLPVIGAAFSCGLKTNSVGVYCLGAGSSATVSAGCGVRGAWRNLYVLGGTIFASSAKDWNHFKRSAGE